MPTSRLNILCYIRPRLVPFLVAFYLLRVGGSRANDTSRECQRLRMSYSESESC